MGRIYKTAVGLTAFLLLITAEGCVFERKNSEGGPLNSVLMGYWYYCSEETGYNECYFLEDSTLVFFDSFTGEEFLKFRVDDDSLIIYGHQDFETSFFINALNSDSILLIQKDLPSISLIRIHEEVDVERLLRRSEAEWNKFGESFLDRSNNKCIKDYEP
jgi:hypothetical protein